MGDQDLFLGAPFWYTAVKHKEFGMQPAEKPSLYDRLGGVYSIAMVVDELIDRIMADPRLNANSLVDEANHRGIQVRGDRDGLLGRPAGNQIHRQPNAGGASPLGHH